MMEQLPTMITTMIFICEKNMEWGAVAYLSQSKYGKYGNTLYSGNYRRIYKNNYYQYTRSRVIKQVILDIVKQPQAQQLIQFYTMI